MSGPKRPHSSFHGRLVPSDRMVVLFALGLLPAVLSVGAETFAYVALGLNLAAVLLCVADYLLAPGPGDVDCLRSVEKVLSSGSDNPVRLRLGLRGGKPLRGLVKDCPPEGVTTDGHRFRFSLSPSRPEQTFEYRLSPPTRGDLQFGDLFLRLSGPLGLCFRQLRVPAQTPVKAYPNLLSLTRDALQLARASEHAGERALRRSAEGREFEALREYREGDDYRMIDWKASARRARTTVRVYQPERNQSVMLLLDCGRHMAGQAAGRRKLDHAVDAALRVAKVCLDEGDQVGVLAFASDVRAFLPPGKGADHLRALVGALYRVEASFEESDYGRALDVAFLRHHRRTLVLTFTDLMDEQTQASLVQRTLLLRPRHLPLVASLLDEDLAQAATEVPREVQAAYVRQVAAGLEAEYRRTATRLRDAGALVIRAPARSFSAATVNEYLKVKAHGLL